MSRYRWNNHLSLPCPQNGRHSVLQTTQYTSSYRGNNHLSHRVQKLYCKLYNIHICSNHMILSRPDMCHHFVFQTTQNTSIYRCSNHLSCHVRALLRIVYTVSLFIYHVYPDNVYPYKCNPYMFLQSSYIKI